MRAAVIMASVRRGSSLVFIVAMVFGNGVCMMRRVALEKDCTFQAKGTGF